MADGGNKILVADDNPDILAMVAQQLSARGYDVLTAVDGEQALTKCRDEQPELVVLDVMMPHKNGWEVARALKQDESTRAIRVVILTAIGESINEMTSPLYGADAHIDKPFEFDVLESTIANLLADPE